MLADTAKTLHSLPSDPPASLPAFAARVLGSAHAQDDGTPLATLVLSGVRALTGFPDGTGARWRREAWASAGLLRDDVSSMVLTLRQLASGQVALAPTPTLRICENPTVLSAAADAYGSRCPPLVCLQGQPSAAAVTLLRQAHAQGATLLYHSDFDWGGLRIATGLLRHVPWLPWRYKAADYRRAAAGAPLAARLTKDDSVTAPWDAELPRALREVGVRVEEEVVLDDLLADLAL